MTIDERNALRAASGLPLLNGEREAGRAKGANDQVDFEMRFSRERPRFAHEWSGNRDGWLSNMGRWLRAGSRSAGRWVRSSVGDRWFDSYLQPSCRPGPIDVIRILRRTIEDLRWLDPIL